MPDMTWDDVWAQKRAMLEHVYFNSLPATWHESQETRDEAIEAYTYQLRDLSPQLLAEAIDRVCKTHEFGWPVPAKVIEAAAEIRDEKRALPTNPPIAALPDGKKQPPPALIADKEDWVETGRRTAGDKAGIVLIRNIPHALLPDGPEPYFMNGNPAIFLGYLRERFVDQPDLPWLKELMDKLPKGMENIGRNVAPVEEVL